ncbi:unnamed protein product [Arctogadus glacialis]
MAPTAVEILSRDRLLLKGEMKKVSEEWEERTEGSGSICPMGGTFDPIMYRNMEVIIKNYIDNRSGKTASAKRDREKLVLALFLEEGERWRTLQRVAGEIIANNNKAQPLPLKVEPPLHKLVSLYPLVTGNVEFKGEVTLDEGDNKCNTQGWVSGDPGTEVSGCSTSVLSPTPLELDKKCNPETEGPVCSKALQRAPHTSSGSYPTLVDGQQALSPPVQQPQSQQSPTPPVTHVHIHNYGNPTNRNRQNQNEWPQGQFRNNQQHGSQGQRRGPLICYGCNMEGHIRRNCLANPYPPKQTQGNSDQGQAGPFMGQGY